MGRAPCCDKANVKKGPWSPEEDAKLKTYIEQHGTGGNWIALPQKIGLKRCGKSCRLRWLNYLRPNIRHGDFSEEEDNIICSLYISIGSRWSIIAAQLPGRTDNDIKNYWNTRLKKKLLGKQRKQQQARRVSSLKQDIVKRESENFVVSEAINQVPHWPQQPVTIPKENSTNFQYPFDISSIQDPLFDQNSIDLIASSTSMNNNTTCCQFPDTHYVGAGSDMFQRFNNFPIGLDDMVYSIPLQLDGILESFSGVDMVNGSTGTSTSAESTSWGDASSLVYPQMVSNYEASQQGMLKDCAFQESRFFGLQ